MMTIKEYFGNEHTDLSSLTNENYIDDVLVPAIQKLDKRIDSELKQREKQRRRTNQLERDVGHLYRVLGFIAVPASDFLPAEFPHDVDVTSFLIDLNARVKDHKDRLDRIEQPWWRRLLAWRIDNS